MPPRLYCDFNDRLDRVTYGLRVRGTRDDVARLGLHLEPGMQLTLYDEDALEDGSPTWLLADAVVVVLPSGEYAAEVDPDSFRWEPRHGESAPRAG